MSRRSEDVARALADPRLTPARVEAYLLAQGWVVWARDASISATWFAKDRDRIPAFMIEPGLPEMEEIIEDIAVRDDAWWLDTATAILNHPLPGEGQEGSNDLH